jgi:hypothetical protein
MNEKDETQKIIEACANLLVSKALELIEKDPHQWSHRPCATCRTVSAIVGRPFGCEKLLRLPERMGCFT